MIDSIWNVSKVKLYATTCIKNFSNLQSSYHKSKYIYKELACFMLGIMFVYCEQQKKLGSQFVLNNWLDFFHFS